MNEWLLLYGFIVVAVLAVGASTSARVGVGRKFFGSPDEEKNQKIRLAIFVGWTLVLPLIMLIEWHHWPPPPKTEMPRFTYARKVATDLWAAIAAVLALLWGIKK